MKNQLNLKTTSRGGGLNEHNRLQITKPFGVEHTFFIRTLVRVRAKVVALRLDQVSRQYGCTVAVVVSDSG